MRGGALPLEEPTSPTPTAAVVSRSNRCCPSSSVNSQPPKSPKAPLKTPLLLKYENLTKSQAVQSLLLKNAGNILHVDCIIHALYGKLGSDAIREEKPRLFDTLSKDTGIGTVGQSAQSLQMLYYRPKVGCFRELADKTNYSTE